MFADAHPAIHAWLTQRDQSAAAWLVDTHRPHILRAARAWGAPAEMEEDAVQEVLLRVFRALPRYEPREPFAHWLGVITRNTCAKLRRRWCHRHKLSACFENAAADVADIELPHTRAPDRQMMLAERLDQLGAALGQLSPREREILERQTLDHEPAETTAASLGMKAGAVRTSLCRLRKQLRAALEE